MAGVVGHNALVRRAELGPLGQRPSGIRSLAVLSLAALVVAGCRSSPAASDASGAPEPAVEASTDDSILDAPSSSDVVIQLGDYDLGSIPDMFVFGPEIVIYRDRTVYAELLDGEKGDVAQYRLVGGRLPENELERLLRDAKALPPTSPVGEQPSDGLPLVLDVTGEQTWDIYDESAQPFAAFLTELRSAVRQAATEPWSPARWIVRSYGDETCSVVPMPSEAPWYEAPVYPHLLDRYPLGVTNCYPAP